MNTVSALATALPVIGAADGFAFGTGLGSALSADFVPATARTLAGRFQNASPDAIRNAKQLLNQSLHQDVRTMGFLEVGAQGELRETAYHKAAVKRFLAKEPALFDWDAQDKDAG